MQSTILFLRLVGGTDLRRDNVETSSQSSTDDVEEDDGKVSNGLILQSKDTELQSQYISCSSPQNACYINFCSAYSKLHALNWTAFILLNLKNMFLNSSK